MGRGEVIEVVVRRASEKNGRVDIDGWAGKVVVE